METLGTNTPLEELESAVSQNPGSPAFAVLAERYLALNRVEEALKVCQQGFSLVPSYERGALAYLTVLRRLRDLPRASEVYSKAVAFVPRSARLRLAWSTILAEMGRDGEARRLAREAMDLDPLNKEARALVATLGGTPTFQATNVPNVKFSSEGPPSFDDSDGGQPPPLNVQAAAIRPRVRPIGQRTTPHQLFDLTPGPAFHEHMENLERFGPSPFDITPPPVDVEEVPGLGGGAAGAEPPSEDAGTAPDAGGDPITIPVRKPGAGVPLPSSDLQPLTVRKPRWWLRILGLVVVLALAGAGGFLFYQHVQERALVAGIDAALQLAFADDLPGFRAAQGKLDQLRAAHPNDQRPLAAMALVQAQTVARHGGDESLVTSASRLAAQNADPRARVARAFLALHAQKPQEAKEMLGGIPQDQLDWHGWLAKILAHLSLGDLKSAAADLSRALPGSASPGVLELAAQHHRLRGELKRSAELIASGLKTNPSHNGLLIEKALLELKTAGKEPTGVQLQSLLKGAGSLSRHRAKIALLTGMMMERRGDRSDLLRLAEEATRLMPSDPEIGARAGIWQLGTGGTVTKAVALLERHGAFMAQYDPSVALWRAWALLLSGRPQEAQQVLTAVSGAPGLDLERYQELQVRCAEYADDPQAITALCAKPSTWKQPDMRRRLACIEAFLGRSQLKPAARLARKINGTDHPGWMGYVNGRTALATGDASAALKTLAEVKPEQLPDPVGIELIRAEALTRQGENTEAIEVLRRATVADSQSVRTRVALAVNLVAGGHDTEAQSILEGVIEDKPTQPSILAQAGEAFLAIGLPGKAQVLVRQAGGTTLNSPSIQLLAGRVALANNELEEAAKMFNAVIKKQPNNPQALLELGRIMATKRQGAKARRLFAKALKLRPKDPQLLLDLSRVHALTGDFKKAYSSAVSAIRLLRKSEQDQRVMEALVELGRILRHGDPWARKKAEEVLYEATKPKTAPTSAFVEMGLLYRQQKDLSRAAWCFRQATTRDPEHAEAHLQLGLVLAKKKKWHKDATKTLKIFLKLRPKGKEAARVQALIRRLR